MKSYILAAALTALASGAAFAQSTHDRGGSYAGVVAGLMEVGGGCASTPEGSCDHRGKFAKLYAGTQVGRQWFAEVSLIDFGRAQFSTVDRATSHAIGFSLAYRQKMMQHLTLSARTGLAYMQTNLKVEGESGVTVVTTQKLQPLLGFGAELALMDNISAVASVDFSRVKIAEHSARVNSYGLGLSINFEGTSK